MSSEALTPTIEDEIRPFSAADFISGIESYLADATKDKILRPHQDVVFLDFVKFLKDGANKGYVTAPTGTGKTVIFVELTKALLAAEKFAGRPPKILVVEPTIELVHQTLGRTGQKGYGKFAPGLQIASYFSDSSQEDKRLLSTADVAVTTYDSLSLMTRREEMRQLTEEEQEERLRGILDSIMKQYGPDNSTDIFEQLMRLESEIKNIGKMSTGKTLFEKYDVILLDEAHNVFGSTTASIIDDIGKDKLVIGFTATPNANEKKRLSDHLPYKIHELTFKEAIDMELLAPLASIGIKSNTAINGSDIFDKEGEYRDEELAYLIKSKRRNKLIIDAAEILIKEGFGTIISCVAGGGARHAEIIADGITGRGYPARAVHGNVPSGERRKIYEDFEKGKLHALTNIKLLSEGWDSTRAKAKIEASPTRSIIRKQQRIGRVVRPGDIAVVLDIIDDYDKLNPPLHLPDLLGSEPIETGTIIGNATPEQQMRIANLISELGQVAIVADKTPADYSKLFDTLAEYQEIVSGRVRTGRKGHFATPETLSPRYEGLSDEILINLWRSKGVEPDAEVGRQGFTIRLLFNVDISLQLLREAPVCEKTKAWNVKGERWISAEGFTEGFNSFEPRLDTETMQLMLDDLGDSVSWRALKHPLPRSQTSKIAEFEVYKAYKADQATLETLKKQIKDYFEIIEINSGE